MISEDEKQLISTASLCSNFKSSEMYVLLDNIMAAMEAEALAALSAARGRDELYEQTIRWQERKSFRQRVKDEIETNIIDAQQLVSDMGLDPDEWQIRSVIDGR